MKRILITAFTLAACAGTQLFAQNVKEDVLTFNLSRQNQVSVSTSSSSANAGLWTAPPTVYKTKTTKLTTADILRAIAIVLYANPNAYSSQAKLVLVQGELGGFFGLKQPLESNVLYTNAVVDAKEGLFYPGVYTSTFGALEGRLATGRNFEANPDDGRLAPGHDQPWGQVFVKDQNATVCDNVTFFFNFDVVECYDCFYLNSFITDSKFTFQERQGPPCCAGSSATSGNGKDKYFMYLSFDNMLTNPYLNPESDLYVGWLGGKYAGIEGLYEIEDGVTPDALEYEASIFNNVANPVDQHEYDVYTMRFTIAGIVTYTWKLQLLNSTDAVPDFVGSATYPAYGYGFIAKTCSLITGTASFAEKVVKSTACCLDRPWYESWYGVGYGYGYYGESEVNIITALSYHEIPYGMAE
jgi:hypothetical protein